MYVGTLSVGVYGEKKNRNKHFAEINGFNEILIVLRKELAKLLFDITVKAVSVSLMETTTSI